MSDEKKDYDSAIAETVDASAEFINKVNIKKLALIVLLAIVCGAAYVSYLLIQIKLEIIKNNELVIKETQVIKSKN